MYKPYYTELQYCKPVSGTHKNDTIFKEDIKFNINDGWMKQFRLID